MRKLICMAAGLAAAIASPAFAGTQSNTLAVTMNVTTGCAFTNSSSTSGMVSQALLDFGTVTSGQTGVANGQAVSTSNGGSALTFACSSLTSTPTLTLDAGLNASGTQRRMVGPASTEVAYNLYSDAGHNSAYTAGTAYPLTLNAANTPTPVPVYGQVPDVTEASAAGTYTDTVTMTLTF